MKPFEQQNYYELLEIAVSATPEEIRAAYERALEFYSPESVALYALVDEGQLETLRGRLTEAMEFLTDPELRAEYDRSIGVAAPPVNTVVPPLPELAPAAVAPAVAEVPAGTEPPSPPLQPFALSYVPRTVLEPGQFNSVAFFTSFTIPVRTPPPAVAEAAPRPQERSEAPASEARPAEPAPGASTPEAAAAPPPVVDSTPPPPSEVPGAVPAPVEKPAATAEPLVDAAELIAADAVDEVTPARLVSHPRAPGSARPSGAGAPARSAEPSRSPGASASPRAVPPPLPPRGGRRTSAASHPTEPPRAVSEAPRREAAAGSGSRPEPTPASPPAEAGLVPAPPRGREQPRSRPLDIPADAEFNGELLRRVREGRGYSLHQVAERTRISLRHLENVEADRYKDLPAQVYLRGILMNLARELGLDPLRVSRSYLALASKASGQ